MKPVLFPIIFFLVKLNCINQKACLVNLVFQLYLHQILFSIIFWITF